MRNSADALLGPVREFLSRPSQEGLFVACVEEGVDVIVQVVGEAPAGLAADCVQCGHRARFERGKADVARACAMCRAPLAAPGPARPDEKFNVFAWRVAWTRDGFEGLGYGKGVDDGTFTDSDVLDGIAQMHSVLRLYLPLFDSLNVTTMTDYRALTAMQRGPPFAEARVRGLNGGGKASA